MLIFVPHHVTFFLDHNYSTSRRRRGRREARCSLGTEKQSSDLKAIQLEQGVSPYDPTRRDCNTHHPTIRAFTSLYHSAQIINPVVVLTNRPGCPHLRQPSPDDRNPPASLPPAAPPALLPTSP